MTGVTTEASVRPSSSRVTRRAAAIWTAPAAAITVASMIPMLRGRGQSTGSTPA